MTVLRAVADGGESLLDEYLETRAEISRLQERLDELKPQLTSALMEEDKGEVVYRGQKFVLYYRASGYTYSSEVKKLETELSALRTYERKMGKAEPLKRAAHVRVEQAPEEDIF